MGLKLGGNTMQNIVNVKRLHKNIEKSLVELQSPDSDCNRYTTYERLAKAYLYLEDFQKFEQSIHQCIYYLSKRIQKFEDEHDTYNTYRYKYRLCVLMWLNQQDITALTEDLLDYHSNDEKMIISGEVLGTASKDYLQMALVYFIRGEYDKCVEYYEKMHNKHIHLYLYRVASAMVTNDTESLLAISDDIVKTFAKRRLPIGTDYQSCGLSVWDLYETCLQRLGLPNTIDSLSLWKKENS
jgi:tetratricopeptide (TPR) repeat protein